MKKRIISLIMVLAVITAVFPNISISALAAVDTTTKSSSVYAGPSSTTYPVIGSVSNESVTVYWREGDYVYIRYNITGTSYYKYGYVHHMVVKNADVPSKSLSKVTYVSTVSQTVYASISHQNSKTAIGSIGQYEEISALGTSNDMMFIEYSITGSSQLKRGWVPLKNIKEKTITTANIKGSEEAINWAKSLLGSRDYDGWCLKFVSLAYKSSGISIGSYGTAKECANAKTKYVDYNPPRGALVFFNYTANDGRNLGHIGISLGDGSFIHASTGKGVIISTLKGYNDSKYLGWSYPSN